MKRLAVSADEVKDEFGMLFLPVYKEILTEMLTGLKNIQTWFEDNPEKIHAWGNTFLGTLYDVEAEVVRVSMLLDKIGGSMTNVGMLFTGIGQAFGREGSPMQKAFEFFAQSNIDLANRYEESNKRLEDLALKRNALDNPPPIPKSNSTEAAAGGAAAAARDSAEKNHLLMEQNKSLLASYWSVNDAIAKLIGTNKEQANAQDMVYFSSKEYLDLIKNNAPLAQAILDEQKHLHSLQTIDAAYKDLTAHLAALKEMEGTGQAIQAMNTEMMTDPFERQRQAQKDSYSKRLDDIKNYVTQKEALLASYDALGISRIDQRYQDEQALINKAKDTEFAIEQKYAHDQIALEQQIAIEKIQILSTTIGQVAQLMMTGNKREFEEGKKLAEAEAGINVALAMVKVNGELGPIYGTVAAVGIVAATSAQISKIEGQQYTALAAGGPVEAGGSYLVGEQGPELIKMGSAGTVIPNNALAQAGKEQLDATHDLVNAVKENTAAVTKFADGLTKNDGMLTNFFGYFWLNLADANVGLKGLL